MWTTIYPIYPLNPRFRVLRAVVSRSEGGKMTRTGPPAPLTDGRYWRRLLATCHPDKPGGDHDLFVFLQGLREHVQECLSLSEAEGSAGPSASARHREGRADRGGPEESPSRVPFDAGVDFDERTRAILACRGDLGEPYAHVLGLLANCAGARRGRAYEQQYRGATWKQVAAIAHAAGMNYQQRQEFYKVAESIKLSQRHAGRILGRLKREEAA
jgi:hypothetical protein